ncbi:Yip1 family protein [Calderihabitans maritimus]|uniref:Yip1 domain-containing protein n=1 Tax=Calderihabitans maritimus TaxID=1246530 RepID=A0A1Z5HW67_9FIRM|nr:Yip1 family protein [Calderihabitans maritimus]GAW93779.1 hypothetical protein Swol_2413 [Calderihabitans maritimus]
MNDEQSRDLSLVDLLYGVIVQPSRTLRYVAQKKLYFRAFGTYLGVQLFNSLMTVASFEDQYRRVAPPWQETFLNEFPFQQLLLFWIPVAVIGSLVIWFIMAGVLHLIAEFSGGIGSGIGLFAALGFTTVPNVLLTVVDFILRLLQIPADFFIRMAGFVWIVVLQVLALRESHQFSTGKAILVFITPLVVMIGIFMALGVAFIGTILPFLKTLPQTLPGVPPLF